LVHELPTGVDWVAPSTDPPSIRQAKARAGVKDNSDRVFTGKEIDKLLNRATPIFKALILLGVNCGPGPSDLARIRWHMLDLAKRRLIYPRDEESVRRVALAAMQLSKDRAAEVARILVNDYKVDGSRIKTIGRSWEEPISKHPEENRRVELQ
jgi:integrase